MLSRMGRCGVISEQDRRLSYNELFMLENSKDGKSYFAYIGIIELNEFRYFSYVTSVTFFSF